MPHTSEHPPFAVTVDAAVLTIRADALHALVVTRGVPPFLGSLALPGGFVHVDEDLASAVQRELREETALSVKRLHLEQLKAYGHPGRDPRQRTVSVAFLAVLPDLANPVGGDDAADAHWHRVTWLLARRDRLAFDHRAILRDAVDRARSKLEYSALGTAFCPARFTVAELRRVYEIVWGVDIDPGNFHRKVTGAPGFIEAAGVQVRPGRGRPAALYRRGRNSVLHPPLTRRALL
jgi:8-oxo-dGTP diphosphatase